MSLIYTEDWPLSPVLTCLALCFCPCIPPVLPVHVIFICKERPWRKMRLLLVQSFSAGVGNWVADEILYQARIHPEQKAASLSEEQSGALHEQMQVKSPAGLVMMCCA